MTMEITDKQEPNKEPRIKKIVYMERGEVCYVPSKGEYIMRVGFSGAEDPCVWLILKNEDDVCWYKSTNTYHNQLEVRELFEGESITVKFS